MQLLKYIFLSSSDRCLPKYFCTIVIFNKQIIYSVFQLMKNHNLARGNKTIMHFLIHILLSKEYEATPVVRSKKGRSLAFLSIVGLLT